MKRFPQLESDWQFCFTPYPAITAALEVFIWYVYFVIMLKGHFSVFFVNWHSAHQTWTIHLNRPFLRAVTHLQNNRHILNENHCRKCVCWKGSSKEWINTFSHDSSFTSIRRFWCSFSTSLHNQTNKLEFSVLHKIGHFHSPIQNDFQVFGARYFGVVLCIERSNTGIYHARDALLFARILPNISFIAVWYCSPPCCADCCSKHLPCIFS